MTEQTDQQLLDRLPPGELKDELQRRLEGRLWIMAYMGHCHAANLEEAQLASASWARRNRFKTIMEDSAAFMSGEKSARPVFAVGGPEQEFAGAIARLRKNACLIPTKE